ncbi:MAG: hypothetical protein ACYTXI_16145 [Nostoc sp.]
MTPGGRVSLPDEYRIQMTSYLRHDRRIQAGPTILMGYYPDLKMFAGFD